jgi:hypothetical protein
MSSVSPDFVRCVKSLKAYTSTAGIGLTQLDSL